MAGIALTAALRQDGPRRDCTELSPVWTMRRLRQTRGFSLIELLVVIATLAILMALLLPVLTQAKSLAKSAKCKNHLRQMVLAMRMYVDDSERYPDASTFLLRPVGETDHNFYSALDPYLSPAWTHFWTDGTTQFAVSDVYQCTEGFITRLEKVTPGGAAGSATAHGWNRYSAEAVQEEFDSGYVTVTNVNIRPLLGYNKYGARKAGSHSGLSRAPESEVLHPSLTIAMACNGIGGGIHQLPFTALFFRHRDKANVAFCDGHVEAGDAEYWMAETAEARRRWNRDYEPRFPVQKWNRDQ